MASSLDETKHHKSPYFSLADPALLQTIAHPSTVEAPKHKPGHTLYRSLIELFGPLNEMSDDSQAKFLLALLKNGSFEPDWKATAKDIGVNNGHNV